MASAPQWRGIRAARRHGPSMISVDATATARHGAATRPTATSHATRASTTSPAAAAAAAEARNARGYSTPRRTMTTPTPTTAVTTAITMTAAIPTRPDAVGLSESKRPPLRAAALFVVGYREA